MRIPILVAAALVVTAALAIEPPKERPAAPAASQPGTPAPKPGESADPPAPQAGAPAETPAPAEEELEELPPLPPDVTDAGPPPQRFTPTEKVRADFPVSYPIDI